MSLFEDEQYEYRDTFFVFLDRSKRPNVDAVEACLVELGSKYEVLNVKSTDGEFESLTIKSPYDFSAMDIAYVEGEEVTTQITQLMEEFRTMTLVGDDHKKLAKLQKADGRFDVFHFEQVSTATEDDFLDPGGLLIVMQQLVNLTGGVGFDPQSQTLS